MFHENYFNFSCMRLFHREMGLWKRTISKKTLKKTMKFVFVLVHEAILLKTFGLTQLKLSHDEMSLIKNFCHYNYSFVVFKKFIFICMLIIYERLFHIRICETLDSHICMRWAV